jgi:hypothetical protein
VTWVSVSYECCVLSGRGLCVVSALYCQVEVCVLLVLCVVSAVCCQVEVGVLLVMCAVR